MPLEPRIHSTQRGIRQKSDFLKFFNEFKCHKTISFRLKISRFFKIFF
jgi:hypothetical protein